MAEKHGLTRTPEWVAWRNMRRRCDSPCRPDFHRYGGRGLQVSARWHSFLAFLADVGPRPTPEHSLDRLDNDKGYEPGNVAWRTKKEQGRNRCTNRLLTLDGVSRPVVEWAEMLGIKEATITKRLRIGWSVAAALTTPVRRMRRRSR